MIDILRDAEYVTGRRNFEWFTISADGAEVAAMNHLRIRADYSIENTPACDVVVVCAGLGGHLIDDDRVFRWLRKQYSDNVVVGSIATGTWVLAKAGLLHDHKCTVHWEDIPAFEETYPRIDVARMLYVRDRQIFTCTGGTAAIDLFLQFVTESLGAEVSSDVARQIIHQSVRVGSDLLPIKDSPYLNIPNRALHDATVMMHDNLENPVPISDIAKRVGVSQKHLERLFRSFFRSTPQLHYRTIRLDHARALVRLTKFEIWQIAIIAGFSSAQYFSRCYRSKFSITPTEERRMLVQYAIPGQAAARLT
ncbi:GlxA family transcriptional regulator [Albidovulum aquaemixtae]|nr:GlxA family transcriptional regulator [Defluviimonas aquaemixtae]